MKILISVLIAVLIGLQYKLWVGDGSLSEVVQLSKELKRQEDKLHLLEQRNSVLEAQVLDLQNGLDAFEEKARNDLGMIKQGETFIQLIPGPSTLSNEQLSEPLNE
jgi:cell division protein FtsB